MHNTPEAEPSPVKGLIHDFENMELVTISVTHQGEHRHKFAE